MKRGHEMSGSLSNKLNVALIQMESGRDIRVNFKLAEAYLIDAVVQHKAEFIVYPENFLCLGVDDYSLLYADFQDYIEVFKALAKEHKISILLGSIPIPVDKHTKKCYSRSLLINENGQIACFYDKIHLFDVLVNDAQGQYKESDSFKAGQNVKVAPLLNHQLGLSICYDLRFPELYMKLRAKGAQILAVPSAFTYNTGQAHWEILLRSRAIETQCFVLAANQCGEHLSGKNNKIRKTWGHSMIVDPWGKVLSSLESSPGVCSAELDFNDLMHVRESMDIMSHRKL